jgi:hypothetical protein
MHRGRDGDLVTVERQFGRLDVRRLQGSGASSFFRVRVAWYATRIRRRRKGRRFRLRAEVSERQLDFARSPFPLPRAVPHAPNIQYVEPQFHTLGNN